MERWFNMGIRYDIKRVFTLSFYGIGCRFLYRIQSTNFCIHLPANHKLHQPFCYEKHMHFLDTADYNTTNPIYINIVRHPIDRIVSWYYYARSLTYIVDVSGRIHHNFSETEIIPRLLPDMKMMKTTFEKCATDNNRVCSYPIGMSNSFISPFHFISFKLYQFLFQKSF